MRNFPKQINKIAKLRTALVGAQNILRAGGDLGDDGLYGYGLVRAGAYTYPRISPSDTRLLERRIATELGKPVGSQGARTAARELRKFLMLLGFLRYEADWEVTATGDRLCAIPDIPDAEARALWRTALLDLMEESAPTHPARNMMRIMKAEPDIERLWLAFAFDMADDSDRELQRVLTLIRSGDFGRARQAVGASESVAANAVKVLPAMLEQAGLIAISDHRCRLTRDGDRVLGGSPTTATAARPANRATRRGRHGGYPVASGGDVREGTRQRQGARSEEDQIHQAARLDERTQEHQALLRTLISRLVDVQDIRCSPEAFDLCCRSSAANTVLLFEVKTVRGDGVIQARAAVGQLLFYEFFDVEPAHQGSPILKAAVFDAEPGQDAREFLEHCGIECVVFLDGGVVVSSGLVKYISQ